MARYRVKVQFVTEIESESQQQAIAKATEGIPASTMNVQIECWTPKDKAAIAEVTTDSNKDEHAAAAA